MQRGLSSLSVLSSVILWVQAELSTYTNPILPGWNSDPSCALVAEWNNTYFCTTSSFLTFPGIPVYASKDLVNWKLASNALSQPDQIRDMFTTATGEQAGTPAITLRYHDGMLYLITLHADWLCPTCWKKEFIIFKTADPYDDAAWIGPIPIDSKALAIDPDLFWDDDGQVYVAASGIQLQSVNLDTGETSNPVNIWNGTGGESPEGPHLYKKDGWYYLLIAEGGTEMNHAVTIARSKDVFGPYESFAGNPILTNRNTTEYFQTVGHADLFQDVAGNWWGVALSTRSGPEWTVYPMGRESVLYPARWDKDEWPVLEPVKGRMRGPLPPQDRSIPGSGNWVDAGERLRFPPASDLPRHLVHWRPPPNRAADYAVSPRGHPNTLALRASRANLTAYPGYLPRDGQTFIARRQSHTFFEFSVDVSAHLTALLQETGISLFLTSRQHLDLGIIMLPGPRKGLVPHIRLNTVAFGKPNATVPHPVAVPLPKQWRKEPIRLQVAAHDDRTFVFSASTPSRPHDSKVLGSVGGEIVSGGSGPFTGSLLGAYATTNGGKQSFKSYISRWTYTPLGQKIDNSE
ncbi:glycosyl hydrolase [Aspergillus carlsbadensis]|nr:glycosyl hydrolase [Aspergillus carlsbadensis]